MSIYSTFPDKAERTFAYMPVQSKEHILAYIHYQIQRQLSPQTIKGAICQLNHFFKQLAEDKKFNLGSIAKSDIRSFIELLTRNDLTGTTINNHLSHLSSFFSFLVDEERIDKNPILTRYYVEQAKRLPRPMKPVHLKVFLEHLCVARDRAIFLLMLRSGLRVREVSNLQLNHIKWDKKQIIVYNGKGKVDRVTYFSRDAEIALLVWIELRTYDTPYCFYGQRNKDRPFGSRGIQIRMNQLLKECGLTGKGYSCHTLRHNFATDLLNAGVSLPVLKDLMGHKSLNQTLMYAQLCDRKVQDTYNRAIAEIEKDFALLKETTGDISSEV